MQLAALDQTELPGTTKTATWCRIIEILIPEYTACQCRILRIATFINMTRQQISRPGGKSTKHTTMRKRRHDLLPTAGGMGLITKMTVITARKAAGAAPHGRERGGLVGGLVHRCPRRILLKSPTVRAIYVQFKKNQPPRPHYGSLGELWYK